MILPGSSNIWVEFVDVIVLTDVPPNNRQNCVRVLGQNLHDKNKTLIMNPNKTRKDRLRKKFLRSILFTSWFLSRALGLEHERPSLAVTLSRRGFQIQLPAATAALKSMQR